ncbi:CHRD domain-containing protein [Lichenihabitans psoromatis]|uniref:CHRD domain-containing protein n=1 Tax=Lichenihabitans psoromatis TaxID=2528642 RepID=UPI00103850B8|nr:CHRD domain-containing protein [Lichenihabitans psoromatis]
MRSFAFAAALVVAAVAAAPAFAETMEYKANLSAETEVPPHADLKGTGTVAATFDTTSMKLSYKVDYQGLTGTATAAHFHGPAAVGANAGVMVPVAIGSGSPIEGSATLTADQAKALEDGKMYFNIHTEANKGGEIRGQVEKAM